MYPADISSGHHLTRNGLTKSITSPTNLSYLLDAKLWPTIRSRINPNSVIMQPYIIMLGLLLTQNKGFHYIIPPSTSVPLPREDLQDVSQATVETIPHYYLQVVAGDTSSFPHLKIPYASSSKTDDADASRSSHDSRDIQSVAAPLDSSNHSTGSSSESTIYVQYG